MTMQMNTEWCLWMQVCSHDRVQSGVCNEQLGEKEGNSERPLTRSIYIPHQNRPPSQTQTLRTSPHQTSNVSTHDFVTRSSNHPQTHDCPHRMFHKWVTRQQQRLSNKARTKVAKKGRQDTSRMALLSHRLKWRREWMTLYSFNEWHKGGGGEDLNMAASRKTS